MKQVYFAVAVNSDGSMYVDIDLSLAGDKYIWNEDTEDWEDVSEPGNDALEDKAYAQLLKLIHYHNEQLTKEN